MSTDAVLVVLTSMSNLRHRAEEKELCLHLAAGFLTTTCPPQVPEAHTPCFPLCSRTLWCINVPSNRMGHQITHQLFSLLRQESQPSYFPRCSPWSGFGSVAFDTPITVNTNLKAYSALTLPVSQPRWRLSPQTPRTWGGPRCHKPCVRVILVLLPLPVLNSETSDAVQVTCCSSHVERSHSCSVAQSRLRGFPLLCSKGGPLQR